MTRRDLYDRSDRLRAALSRLRSERRVLALLLDDARPPVEIRLRAKLEAALDAREAALDEALALLAVSLSPSASPGPRTSVSLPSVPPGA